MAKTKKARVRLKAKGRKSNFQLQTLVHKGGVRLDLIYNGPKGDEVRHIANLKHSSAQKLGEWLSENADG